MNGQGEYNVDIVFCVDGTESMQSAFEKLKKQIKGFHYQYIDAMDEIDKSVDILRVKWIVFNVLGEDGADGIVESPFYDLPHHEKSMQAFVDSIQANGKTPKKGTKALEAIALAIKSDWTKLNGKKRHTVVVLSNSPVAPLEEKAGMPKDLSELGAWWEGTDQYFVGSYNPVAGRMLVFAPNAEPWTELNAWNRYWHIPTTKDMKEMDMQAVIDLLTGSI